MKIYTNSLNHASINQLSAGRDNLIQCIIQKAYVINNREDILYGLAKTRTVNGQAHGVDYDTQHNTILEPHTVDEALGVRSEPGPDV